MKNTPTHTNKPKNNQDKKGKILPDPQNDPIVANNIVNAEFNYTYDKNRQ